MADLSPELAAKIQTLEASYAENRGRYFVALAGAWREAGEIGRAEEILRENVGKYSGLSAHVLLGRCLADRGAFPEAANEFHYVLSLDAQNLIALRTLAEMAAATGRRAEAERWYNELLAVDPMNAEARTALAELARGGADASVVDQPTQVGSAWGGAAEPAPVAGGADAGGAGEFGMIDLSAPDASPADASGVAADDEREWGDLPLDLADEPAPAAAGAPAGDFDAFGFGSVNLDAGARTDDDPWLAAADARQDLGESAAADQGFTDPDETLLNAPVAGADLPFLDTDDTVRGDDLALLDADATTELGGFDTPPHADAGFSAGDDLPLLDPGADDHPADHEVDAEVVTETMAELYAAQGLLQQSADTYRELIRQRGEEPGLVRRLAEIEARLHPGAESPAAAQPQPAEEEAPDWLASVDAFAMGGAAASMAAIHMTAEEPAPEPEPAAASADDLFEPVASSDEDMIEPAVQTFEPVDTSSSLFEPSDVATDSFDAGTGAPGLDFPAAGEFDADTPAPVGAAGGDSFADSFRGGFEGAAEEEAPEPAFAAAPIASTDFEAAGDREPWEAPAVRETEPVGFDLIVVEEDGDQVPAPPEVVADVSADWAIAAAPLEDDEEAAEEAVAAAAAPAAAAGSTTMRAYFTGLLAWQPGQSAAAPAAVEEPAVEEPAFAAPAAPAGAPPAVMDEIVSRSTEEEEWAEEPAPPAQAVADDEPWSAAPAAVDADEEPWAEAPAAPAHDLPAAAEPEPADEPWAAPTAEAPAAEAAEADLPLMDLGEDPWASTRPQDPARIDAFTLADDVAAPAPAQEPAAPASADAEEALPWELPPEPAAPASQQPAADTGGGFSFEDFFAGGTSGPAEAPAAAPEPEPVREPEPPAFVPSLAFEPAPPPPAAPSAPAAPAASAPAAGGQEEDDEDLESFQAWLQSLKR